jgi:phosphatidylglycerophosphate synthase
MPAATYQASERRPIAARNWRISQRLASWLVRRGISPNAISLAGMVCGLGAGVALAATSSAHGCEWVGWLTGAVLIQLRLLANLLDGMVAIESGRASRVGELFNEVPDRVSDAAILIGLGYAQYSEPVLGYIAALLAVFTAYVRAMGKVAGAPQFYQGPMAKPHRMWLVTALCLCAICMPASLASRFPLDGLALPALTLAIIIAGCVLTALRRLILIRAALLGVAG